MYYAFEYEEILSSWTNCVVPSVNSVAGKIACLIFFNIMFNLVTHTINICLTTFHILSIILGNLLLYLTVAELNILHFLLFLIINYVFMYAIFHLPLKRGVSAYVIGFMSIMYLLLCEFIHPYQEYWIESRGLFMIASMKIISVSADLQNGLIKLPSTLAFFGYTCFPANSLFGPWFQYKEYIALKEHPHKKSIKWALMLLYTGVLSLFYLTISNCWGTHFIPDDSYKWVLAYRQALSFRTSHYFVSYLSETAMIAAGCFSVYNSWGYPITKPLDIEIPSSLVSVVISWNIPMHRFLKQYVYKTSLRFGQFKAIFITYLVSSLLHGFNLEIASVLLTIGIFSFIQLSFQSRLSLLFNACVNVRPCRNCVHKYKRNNIFVKLACTLFSMITILNLIYLGILMDSVGEPESVSIFDKWQNLDFLSHCLMFLMYVTYNVI